MTEERPAPAAGDDGSREGEPDEPLPPGDAKRPTPDYAGRERPKSAGEALLWVPRVVLFPVWLVTEFVVRRPVGAVHGLVERHRLVARWQEFFTFGEENKVGVFPAGSIDLGFSPTIGVYSFWKDIAGPSDLKLRATTGGLRKWEIDSAFVVPLGTRESLRLSIDFSLLPDRAFYGLGPDTRDDAARFSEKRLDGRIRYSYGWRALSFYSATGLLWVSFDADDPILSDPSLADAIDAGLLPPPPALEDGIFALYTALGARLDTRAPRVSPPPRKPSDLEPRSGTGVALGAHARHYSGLKTTRASDADPPRLPQWLRYGASGLAALDVTGTRRTFELETVVELTSGLPADNPVPFTEQVGLGGDYPLRGFRGGRLGDQSGVVTTLSYRWPVWDSLDGQLHYAVGNVFGEHLDGFQLESLRSSFGVGINTALSLDNPFEMLIAFGTEPFDQGGAVESVRFVFGTRAGFR